jgi:inosose dehydratase
MLNAAPDSKRVGCQTNAWKLPTTDFGVLLSKVRALHELGFRAFECNVRYVASEFSRAREASNRISSTGVAFYGPHTDLQRPLDELKRYVEGAAALGARHFAVSAGPGGNVELDDAAFRRKVELLQKLGEHCRAMDVRLVSHNYPVDYRREQAGVLRLLRETDPSGLAILVDIGNAVQAGTDVARFFTENHARIDAFHLRDLKEGKQVPMGQGTVDFVGLAAAIRRTRWNGWLTLEEESLPSTEDAYVRGVLASSRAEIRRMFRA